MFQNCTKRIELHLLIVFPTVFSSVSKLVPSLTIWFHVFMRSPSFSSSIFSNMFPALQFVTDPFSHKLSKLYPIGFFQYGSSQPSNGQPPNVFPPARKRFGDERFGIPIHFPKKISNLPAYQVDFTIISRI